MSLINHKKVHKKYYQIKNNTDTSTDKKVENNSVTSTEDNFVTSIDEKVEDDTDTSTDKKFEDNAEISADEKVKSNINTSMDEDDTNTCISDNIDIYKSEINIVNNPNIIDQIITCESGQIFEECILESHKTINECQSDDSDCNDPNKINSEEFLHTAYQDFIEIINNEWGHAQQYISSENKVLAIILYSNATMLDHLGKISQHLVFISLDNIPTKFHNKPKTKALVGIILTLQETLEKQQTPQFRQMIQSTFHK
ncbi:13510_t:CDS:2 [Cetraspora pellucida]|uniref:13510_t:CDS:1 n=1 Tax=Cetraspora pellucida TaxID=1433469 RepID=A0ACA9L1Z1_9GLOM|nr:13510_t:CDS:2 [Cetraspora pellucida]